MDELRIGARIAELRNRNNVTQLELARKLGVTDRAVSKWETGGSYPDISLLSQIADIFDVSIDYLLRGKSNMKQKWLISPANCDYETGVNKCYLEKGWRIVDMKLAGDGEGTCWCALLMEKEVFED